MAGSSKPPADRPPRLARLLTGYVVATWWLLAAALPVATPISRPWRATPPPAAQRPVQFPLPWSRPRPRPAKRSLLTYGRQAFREPAALRHPAAVLALPRLGRAPWSVQCRRSIMASPPDPRTVFCRPLCAGGDLGVSPTSALLFSPRGWGVSPSPSGGTTRRGGERRWPRESLPRSSTATATSSRTTRASGPHDLAVPRDRPRRGTSGRRWTTSTTAAAVRRRRCATAGRVSAPRLARLPRRRGHRPDRAVPDHRAGLRQDRQPRLRRGRRRAPTTTGCTDRTCSCSPRFKGMALIPMQDPEEAVEELRRAVDELGMSGAMLPSNGLPRAARREAVLAGLRRGRAAGLLRSASTVAATTGFGHGPPEHVHARSHALGHPWGLPINFASVVYNGIFDRFPGIRWPSWRAASPGCCCAWSASTRRTRRTSSTSRGTSSARARASVPDLHPQARSREGRFYVGCETRRADAAVRAEGRGEPSRSSSRRTSRTRSPTRAASTTSRSYWRATDLTQADKEAILGAQRRALLPAVVAPAGARVQWAVPW